MKQSTASGTEFAILPRQPAGPAPMLLLLAMAATETLTTEPYCRVGRLLHESGWNVVSLDLPCHGADRRDGEPAELHGWAARTAKGEDIVAAFQRQVTDVLDHLIATGVADAARLAAAGTSRGGFMAFQAAAGDRRIRAVAAFSPVTDLLALTEFAGQEVIPLVGRLALVRAAGALAGREAWMTIGSADVRVGTDKAIAFARALTEAKVAYGLARGVTLRVLPTPGHGSYHQWHDEAAEWFRDTMSDPRAVRNK